MIVNFYRVCNKKDNKYIKDIKKFPHLGLSVEGGEGHDGAHIEGDRRHRGVHSARAGTRTGDDQHHSRVPSPGIVCLRG
jgi:hypothetical protein